MLGVSVQGYDYHLIIRDFRSKLQENTFLNVKLDFPMPGPFIYPGRQEHRRTLKSWGHRGLTGLICMAKI